MKNLFPYEGSIRTVLGLILVWPLEKILKLMEQERGQHFDPRLIDLFQSNLERFLAIRDRYTNLPG